MKSLIFLPRSIISVLSIATFVSAANVCSVECIPDSCARAAIGTAGSAALSSPLAQCSSFMTATLYPATVVTTVTSTATIYSISGNTGYNTTEVPEPLLTSSTLSPATVIKPIDLPSYIPTACLGNPVVRYSSACSCAGVTVSTTTLSTPLVTLTQTVTSTSSITTFNVIATQPASSPSYLVDANPNDPDSYSHDLTFTPLLSSASNFSLISGSLEMNGQLLADQDQDNNGEPLYFDLPANIADFNWVSLDIVVDEFTLLLTASNPLSGASTLLNCQGVLYLVAASDTVDIANCGVVDTLEVVPL